METIDFGAMGAAVLAYIRQFNEALTFDEVLSYVEHLPGQDHYNFCTKYLSKCTDRQWLKLDENKRYVWIGDSEALDQSLNRYDMRHYFRPVI